MYVPVLISYLLPGTSPSALCKQPSYNRGIDLTACQVTAERTDVSDQLNESVSFTQLFLQYLFYQCCANSGRALRSLEVPTLRRFLRL